MLELKAHAKLNLGLSVTAKRADGFHELDTLFVRLELHDSILMRPDDEVTLRVLDAELPEGDDNLMVRAARLYLRATQQDAGVQMILKKRIPIAAGLAGGSSDAATVLLGLQQLYPAAVDLPALALELGSDVPFFVQQVSAAQGKGRGEKLTVVEIPILHFVLVNPGLAISARDAYQNLNSLTPPLDVTGLVNDLKRGRNPDYLNALEPGVLTLYPEMNSVLNALGVISLQGVLMSGSGATCFGIAADRQQAEQLTRRLAQSHPEWWVQVSSSY